MNRKKITLIASMLTLSCFSLFHYAREIKKIFCGPRDSFCWDMYNLFGLLLLFGPALLISTLVSFRVSDQVFNAWKKITFYFIPIYTFIIILMPWSVGDEIAGFTKGMVGLVLTGGYMIFSCIYLLTKKH